MAHWGAVAPKINKLVHLFGFNLQMIVQGRKVFKTQNLVYPGSPELNNSKTRRTVHSVSLTFLTLGTKHASDNSTVAKVSASDRLLVAKPRFPPSSCEVGRE